MPSRARNRRDFIPSSSTQLMKAGPSMSGSVLLWKKRSNVGVETQRRAELRKKYRMPPRDGSNAALTLGLPPTRFLLWIGRHSVCRETEFWKRYSRLDGMTPQRAAMFFRAQDESLAILVLV